MDPTTAAQRAAIADVRARYERGEISYDAFRRAVDALMLTETPEECETVLAEVAKAASGSPHAALAALSADGLDAPDVPSRQAASGEQQRALPGALISAILGNTHRTRQSWKLAEYTLARSILGDLKLDLTRAEIPPRATLEVTCVLGSAVVYVPRAMRVRVDSHLVLGEIQALGETTGGIVASSHTEHTPAQAEPAAALDVVVRAIGGNVKIVLVDGPVVSLGDVVRQAARFVAERVGRGLQEQYGMEYSRPLELPRRPPLPGERAP